MGGGIASQIVMRGGDIIQQESNKLSPIETGEAVITSAGNLPARFLYIQLQHRYYHAHL